MALAEENGQKGDLQPAQTGKEARVEKKAARFHGAYFPVDIRTADLVKALHELKERAER